MKALLNVNGHQFSIKNKSLIVDGVLLDIKLKPTIFSIYANTTKIGYKKWKSVIGKNSFIIDDKGFEVNGQNFSYADIDKLKEVKGVLKDSETSYRYKFIDVQITFDGSMKKTAKIKEPAPKKSRNIKISLFKIGDVSQVGSVNDYTKSSKNNKDKDLNK